MTTSLGDQLRSTKYTIKGYRPTNLLRDLRAAHKEGKIPQSFSSMLGFYSRKLGVSLESFQNNFSSFYPRLVRMEGRVLFNEHFHNLVVTAGLNDALDKHFKGSSYTAAWYILLTDGTPTPNAADTMSSHAGWSEVTAYDEAARQTLTLGTISAGSVDNSGSPATFTISANGTTIGGAALTTVSTKGGTSGTLYGIGAFTGGDRTLSDGDTIQTTVTLTASAS